MVELIAKSAFDGLDLPFTAGDVTLSAVEIAEMVSLAPLKGAKKKVSPALKKAIGLELSEVGRWLGTDETQVIWTGLGQWYVTGAAGLREKLAPLERFAGMTPQADGWAVATLHGPNAKDVLARLCPLDLEAMVEGDTARTSFQHMQSIVQVTSTGVTLMVFRSMAGTFVHDLKGAMTSVAAQNQL